MMHFRDGAKTTQNIKAANVNMLFRNSRRGFILRKADMIQVIVVIVEREEEY
jgi:hypothetical protein